MTNCLFIPPDIRLHAINIGFTCLEHRMCYEGCKLEIKVSIRVPGSKRMLYMPKNQLFGLKWAQK